MVDLLIYETGNGGGVKIVNGDLATTDSFANQPYLAHFGGNVEAITTGEEEPGEERDDWWGNSFFEDEPEAMMNSQLEKALNENTIGSAGRSRIERKGLEDVEFMKEISDVSLSVSLINNDKILISGEFQEIETEYKYLWDAINSELIEEQNI